MFKVYTMKVNKKVSCTIMEPDELDRFLACRDAKLTNSIGDIYCYTDRYNNKYIVES